MMINIETEITDEQQIVLGARADEWNAGHGTTLSLEQFLGEVLHMRFIDEVTKQAETAVGEVRLEKLKIATPELLAEVDAIVLP